MLPADKGNLAGRKGKVYHPSCK